MAVSKDKQAAAATKKPTEKKGRKVSKNPNPSQKRGQPTAAARLISSPFIKFGWHKPLGGAVKETVQHLSSMADSMYMLQIDRERPIEALSLRNAIFWEHRQLDDELIVSTPAVDHIDLFPEDDASFQETIGKIGKKQYDRVFLLHYLFDKMRFREFLLLPIELDGVWVTIVTRTGQKSQLVREVTDFAIVDPVPNGRESRRSLLHRRLRSILAEGFIELSERVTVRDIAIPDIEDGESDDRWKTGLIAYAFAREFLRRLKTLQFRRAQNNRRNSENCEEFLWAAFEEHYNFDAFRQTLMSACAHQTIESSGYQVRLALEVPSDDSNYQPDRLRHLGAHPDGDEKWEIFQSPTHTIAVDVNTQPSLHSPQYSPTSPPQFSPTSPQLPPTSPGNGPSPSPTFCPNSPLKYSPTSPPSLPSVPEEEELEFVGTSQRAPVAEMGSSDLLSQIPGLTLVESQPANAQEALTEAHSAVDSYECPVAPAAVHDRDDNENSSLAAKQSLATVAESVAQATSRKRSSSEIDDGDADTDADAERPTKKMKIEDES